VQQQQKKHMIISINEEIAFHKIEHSVFDKLLRKTTNRKREPPQFTHSLKT
jgi:hypothetical protein